MGDVHGVGGRRDGGPARGAQHAAHKGGKGALLLCAAREALLRAVAAAIAVAVRLGGAARGRGRRRVHVGVEGARGTEVARGLVRLRVLWARGPTWSAAVGAVGAVGSVEGVLDDGVEGLADGGGRQVVRNRGRKLVLGRGVYIRSVVLVVGVVVLVDGCQRRAAAEGSAARCRGRRERRCSRPSSASSSRHSGEACAKAGMGKVRCRTRGALQRICVG